MERPPQVWTSFHEPASESAVDRRAVQGEVGAQRVDSEHAESPAAMSMRTESRIHSS
jgi:hypothetical protein